MVMMMMMNRMTMITTVTMTIDNRKFLYKANYSAPMCENLFFHSFNLSQCDHYCLLILEVVLLVHLITLNKTHTHTHSV
jgi:hypothetical protein